MTGFAPHSPVTLSPMVQPVELEVREMPPLPLHIVGVDIRMSTIDLSTALNVWCSCGWPGDKIRIQLPPDARFDPLSDVPAEALEEAARSWRLHVRLSNRVHRIDRRNRKRAQTADPVDLSTTPEFAVEEARRGRHEEE